ncbi:MAG TPA: diacylglycerol kinase family protein [Candidatus Saccharimonadales bacterium]|nr:diacylglycerol kinase family protein [Candidatus Saccharimonadales bacterium]
MPVFHKALLLFNPVSGAHLKSRMATMRRVADVLRAAGVEAVIEPTKSKGSAGDQARAAINAGCDAVLACGGDGTVFDVLQGVAETNAALGVIPLGTGNVLAHDLGLAGNPERAAAKLLGFLPQSISLGRIQSAGRTRFFTVAAGVGVHAELIYRASARAKQRGGFLAYYQHGARLLFRHQFVPFPVEIITTECKLIQTTSLELAAMRVRSFGGPLRHWRPGSSLLSPDLRLMLMHNANRAYLLRYALQALTGLAPYEDLDLDSPDCGISFISAKSVICHPPASGGAALRVQADGEILGPVPTVISMIPHALNLLLPPTAE